MSMTGSTGAAVLSSAGSRAASSKSADEVRNRRRERARFGTPRSTTSAPSAAFRAPSPPPYVVSAPDFSPSPPAEGGEGRGEEGFSASGGAAVSAVGCPSPQPSPPSSLTGRG